MVYVTQTRPTPGERYTWTDTHSFVPNTEHPYGGIGQGTQTTTSWRTGRSEPLKSYDDAQLSETYAGNFKRLKSEYETESKRNGCDTGHTFLTEAQSAFCGRTRATILGNPASFNGRHYVYRGPLSVDAKGEMFPPYAPAYTGWSSDGTHAIHSTMPTGSEANLIQSLSEIVREGIPQALGLATLKARALSAKSAGSEYLNVEFGWKPLIADIRKAAESVINAHSVSRQFQRDSGRVVRRRFAFPDQTKTEIGPIVNRAVHGFAGAGYHPFFAESFSRGSAPQADSTTTETKRWFSGAYTYYVHQGSSISDKLIRHEQMANHLLGTRLTPATLWELAPWSWLADWGGNFGEFLSNANALTEDSLVIKHGYLMCTTSVVRTRVVSELATFAGGNLGEVSLTTRSIRKQRFQSTPYGFGLDVSAFTPRKWAILGALGLTKTPNSLNVGHF